MANSDLQGNSYSIEEPYQRFLGGAMSYEALKMRKTRMSKAKDAEDFAEFERLGGQDTMSYVDATLKTNRDAIHSTKKIGMDAGRENQFIKKHEKDRDNANPTGVGGVPKMNKGSVNRKIMSNKEVYNESELGRLTQSSGIARIQNIDDMKDLLKGILPESCYKKRYDSNMQRFEITRQGTHDSVIIDNKEDKLRVYYNREEGMKMFDLHQISDLEKYIRKTVEFACGQCFDTNTMNEEIQKSRYLMEYMNTNNKQKL